MNTNNYSPFWAKTYLAIFLASFFVVNPMWGQPPIVDGTINSEGYTQGGYDSYSNNGNNGDYFMYWDDNKLYVAVERIDIGNTVNAVQMYIDVDNNMPVNSGDGSTMGTNYDGVNPPLPFNADYFIYLKNNYMEVKHYSGGAWNTITTSLSKATNPTNWTIEFSIDLADIGITDKFNYVIFKSENTGNTLYHQEPHNGNSAARFYYYQTVDDMTSVTPFSKLSFTQHDENDGYTLNNTLPFDFYDFTINAGSDGNGHVDDACGMDYGVWLANSITISNNLYIGTHGSLLPSGGQTPTITMDGNSGTLYNNGRLDCRCDKDDAGEEITFNFFGTTTLAATDILKSFYRLGNMNVTGTLQAPTSGSVDLELQYGTLNNTGTINFDNGGVVNAGLRGDVGTSHNNYVFTGGGNWTFHNLLIGRNSSKLSATNAVQTLQIKGNFENYDEFDAGDGSVGFDVIFNGTGDQYLKGTADETTNRNTTFHNLTIDKSSGDVKFESFATDGVPASDPANHYIYYDIRGTLTLTDGRLMTRTNGGDHTDFNHHILTLKDGATTTSGNANSFIHGPVFKEGTGDFTFPIGKGTIWARAGVSGITNACSGNASFKAEYFNNIGPSHGIFDSGSSNLAAMSDVEYWDISRNTCGSTEAKVTLYFEDNTRSVITDINTLKVTHFDGTDWDDQNPAITDTSQSNSNAYMTGSAGYITTEAAMTSFSPVTFGSAVGTQLPVELLHFQATARDGQVHLDWATASEENAAFFEVQRSEDGRNYEAIGEVTAVGFSASEQTYRFIDTECTNHEYYYRLRMVDLDETFEYSDMRYVRLDEKAPTTFTLYPNPNKGIFSLDLDPNIEVFQANIYNGMGQLVKQTGRLIGNEIQATELGMGVYYLELQTSNGVMTSRFSIH